MTERHYDVDIAVYAPLRASGAEQRTVISTLRVLAGSNLSASVVDTSTASVAGTRASITREVLDLLVSSSLSLASPGSTLRAQLALVLRPSNGATVQSRGIIVVPDRVLIVADRFLLHSIPGQGEESSVQRDLTLSNLESAFGKEAFWAGPEPGYKEALMDLLPSIAPERLTDSVDLQVLDEELADEPRAEPRSPDRPRIGRHVLYSEPRWPAEEVEIRRVLPTTSDWDVRWFGPHARLLKTLGRRPKTWSLNSVIGKEDLDELDFWIPVTEDLDHVAQDHAVRQAMARGLVVVLPPELSHIFGDAAVYAEPRGVRKLVTTLHSDPRRYRAQSARALEFARATRSEKFLEILRHLDVHSPLAPIQNRTPRPAPNGGRSKYRVAFVTSNGAGMGHLTRLLAIARNLPSDMEAVFVSLSQAVPVVAKYGFPFVYIASKGETGLSPAAWNDYSEKRFTEEFERLDPDALIFDGTWPYRGLLKAASSRNMPLVWSRRGMWKPEIADTSLSFGRRFDLVLQPGEFAEEADKGATTKMKDTKVLNPVTVLDRTELLEGSVARKRLGIIDGERAVLITLGAGNLNSINNTTAQVVKAFKELSTPWRIFLTSNPISAGVSTFTGVDSVELYPVAEYANAFDMTVSAAGYNSFHEWMMACIPTLWIPNTATQTDDQVARAEYAATSGVGACCVDPDEEQLRINVAHMTSPGILEQMRVTLESRWIPNGAPEAASELARLVREGQV